MMPNHHYVPPPHAITTTIKSSIEYNYSLTLLRIIVITRYIICTNILLKFEIKQSLDSIYHTYLCLSLR